MKKLFVVFALLMLVGCGGGKYCHPYKDAQDFERDKYDCKMKTRSGSSEMMLVDLDHFFECLRIEKGWSKCNE